MIQNKIVVEGHEHVFVHVSYEGEVAEVDDVSLDIHNVHGRRSLSVRVGGMSIGRLLLDRDLTPGRDASKLERYCPFCGIEINLVSSKSHVCDEIV